MACPLFEPLEPAAAPRRPGVRLPLIDEYAGVCHASGKAAPPADAMLSAGCNQGYAYACPNYSQRGNPSAMRYSVTSQTEQQLTITWIEEQSYSPLRQGTMCFHIHERRLSPAPTAVIAAQVMAFCRGYLARCPQRKLSQQQHENA